MLPTISRAILGGQQAQVLSCKISELTSEQTVSFPAARARVRHAMLPATTWLLQTDVLSFHTVLQFSLLRPMSALFSYMLTC